MFTMVHAAEVRHVVQRILVPCVLVIGLLGNSVSIYVLTRKRMRCTTNIYLTALAITDIIYLTMIFLLSLQHYDYIQRHCELFWQWYGTLVWLCDACAYISIYIAVCFTIERFIAIRYPLKRQTFCTESLAKKVITGVALFCAISTISTAFEHEYDTYTKLIDIDGQPCNFTLANAPDKWTAIETDFNRIMADLQGSGNGPDEEKQKLLPSEWSSRSSRASHDGSLQSVAQSKATGAVDLAVATAANIPSLSSGVFTLGNSDFLLDTEFLVSMTTPTLQGQLEKYAMQKEDDENPFEVDNKYASQQQDLTFEFNVTDFCENVTYYVNTPSDLAKNSLYTRVWSLFTLFVFVLIPLCVLGTFNCFLIMLVRRSKSLRGEMTNASSMRRSRRKPHTSSVSQENRITVTLIAVVLLFIVCQLPWAIYLILSEHLDIDSSLRTIFGNVFNFLAAINAAANFFLYCVLSDKYRKTVRELITGYRYRAQRNAHLNASLYTNSNIVINGSRRSRPTGTSMVIK